MVHKCPDCDEVIDTSSLEDGEIVSCQGCGLELTYNAKTDELIELTIEGEDFGE